MLSPGQMIVGGLLLLVVAYVLRRSFSQSKTSRARDPLQEAHAEIRTAEAGYAATISKMEVKLNDYAREVEGRIDTKIVVLDRLIVEAKAVIERLEQLSGHSTAPVDDCNGNGGGEAAASHDGQRVVYDLADNGMSEDDIAEQIGEPVSHVRLILKMRHGQ